MLQLSVKSTRMVRVFCPYCFSEKDKAFKHRQTQPNNTLISLRLTDLLGNHLQFIVRSADQDHIQTSACKLKDDKPTQMFVLV